MPHCELADRAQHAVTGSELPDEQWIEVSAPLTGRWASHVVYGAVLDGVLRVLDHVTRVLVDR